MPLKVAFHEVSQANVAHMKCSRSIIKYKHYCKTPKYLNVEFFKLLF